MKEFLSVKNGRVYDRRNVELQADGSHIVRDPITHKTFDISTGEPMNTNDYMTGAELQALREACGLDRDQFGEMCGVQGRSVKYWEMRSGVPADVSEMILKLEAKVRADADDALKRFTGRSGVILMRGADPLKNAANNRVFAALRAIGQDVRMVAFDYKAYRSQPGQDTPEARQAWARMALKEQARPHRQDQPV